MTVDIFFDAPFGYNVTQDANGCENVDVVVNMSVDPTVELFYGAWFRLQWNCTLMKFIDTWVGMTGNLYNGSAWHAASSVSGNPTGDIAGCNQTAECAAMGGGDQGCANILALWDNYFRITNNGTGINATAAPLSSEGTLAKLRFKTSGPVGNPCAWGNQLNYGTTDLEFIPNLEIVGYLDGSFYYDDQLGGIEARAFVWQDTTVTVN